MKKIIFIVLVTFGISLAAFASEKNIVRGDYSVKQNSTINFSKLFNSYKYKPLANLIEKKMNLPSLRSVGKTSLLKLGVNLLINGIVWGAMGGIFIGLGIAMVYFFAVAIGMDFASALASIFVLFLVTDSYYAYLAVFFLITGIILSVLWVLIIPGIILMIIGSIKRASRIKPLTDNIGFSIKLGHNYR